MVRSRHLVSGTVLATVVLAAPQKPDYAAINAAPSVANGPPLVDADADGIQTATLATNFAVTAAATATGSAGKRGLQARDTVVSTDKTDSTYNAMFGTQSQLTTIQQGVTYWINGGSTHNFFGNINNNGRIFVSQSQYLKQNQYAGGQTSDWVGHDANNGNLNNAAGALIQLNDYGSVSAPTYDWYIRSIKNNGTIQWCGRGDTGGSTFQMYSDQDATNNGLISFEQFFSNIGASFVWRNPTLTTTNTIANLYNNGAFRIINVVYHNVQNVYGNGCWQIGKGGVLYLEDGTGVFQNPTNGPSFPGQSITFQDSSAVLHMDTAVYSKNSNFGPQLYNFASGNAIEFYEIIKSFSYSSSTGILNVVFTSNNQVNIKLGTGYNASNFQQKKNPQKYNVAGYNAIFYNGAAPSQSAPAQCSISAPVCSDLSGGLPPISGPSSSSAVVSSTASSTSVAQSTTSKASSSASTSSTGSSVVSSIVSKTSSSSIVVIPSPTSLSSATSTKVSSTPPPTTAAPTTTKAPKTCPVTSYSPYYPALSTGYTTFPGTTTTTDAAHPCPTTPEDGTYCGFLNPLDPCGPQPDGYGPVPTPDTPSAFLAFDKLHAMASAAPSVIPSSDNSSVQYTQVFKDLNAGTQAQSYLGQYTLHTYNATECASKCDCTDLCTSFNLWAERDPSLNPSANDSTAPTVWGYDCPNPHSMTSFKCTLWGSAIDNTTATNDGQWREQFHVVITASDGYTLTKIPTPPTYPNWTAPTDCGGKAIDAPANSIGARFFPGPFNTDVCQSFAEAQAKENVQAGVSTSVGMFNAYYLHKNGKPHGTYCSLYNQDLDAGKWATYGGETVNGDLFECKQSWKFARAS